MLWNTERSTNNGEHEVWVIDRGQVNKDDPIAHVRRDVMANRHCQLRLAHAAGSGQRQEARHLIIQQQFTGQATPPPDR